MKIGFSPRVLGFSGRVQFLKAPILFWKEGSWDKYINSWESPCAQAKDIIMCEAMVLLLLKKTFGVQSEDKIIFFTGTNVKGNFAALLANVAMALCNLWHWQYFLSRFFAFFTVLSPCTLALSERGDLSFHQGFAWGWILLMALPTPMLGRILPPPCGRYLCRISFVTFLKCPESLFHTWVVSPYTP